MGINVNGKAGECPICHSKDIEYDYMDIDGNELFNGVECHSCGTFFEERYSLKFEDIIVYEEDEK